MKNLNELIIAIVNEAKKQNDERNEYISLVHQLIEGTEKIGDESISDSKNTWRINFRMGKGYSEGIIYFSSNISKRENGEISLWDVENIENANKEINECINILYDKGTEYVDNFINYLSKVAIPQFLQNRHPIKYHIA